MPPPLPFLFLRFLLACVIRRPVGQPIATLVASHPARDERVAMVVCLLTGGYTIFIPACRLIRALRSRV